MEEGPVKRFCSELEIEGTKVVGHRGDSDVITNVVIPNGIDEIGDNTFARCIGLTSLTLPHSLKIIGEGPFTYCTALTSVTLPNSLKSMYI